MRFQKIKAMSPQMTKDSGPSMTNVTRSKSSSASGECAQLPITWKSRSDRTLREAPGAFIDSQWQSLSETCISANQLNLHGDSHIRVCSPRRCGKGVWSRQLKGWHDPTRSGECQAPDAISSIRSRDPPSPPSPWLGVDASLLTWAWYYYLELGYLPTLAPRYGNFALRPLLVVIHRLHLPLCPWPCLVPWDAVDIATLPKNWLVSEILKYDRRRGTVIETGGNGSYQA